MDSIVSSKKVLDAFLAGSTSEADAVATLNELKGVAITIQILKDTKIGESLGKLVSAKKGEKVPALALALQNDWKEAARKESESKKRKREEEGNKSGISSDSVLPVKEEPETKRAKIDENGTGSLSNSQNSLAGSTNLKKEESKEEDTKSEALPFNIPTSTGPKPFVATAGNPTRDSVQTKFYNALLVGEQFGELDPHDLAIDIERSLFELKGGANKDYTSSFRSLYSNLNDPLNTGLRHALLNGHLPVAQFVQMTYEELANPKLRDARQAMEKAALEARAEDAKRKGATCTVFVCNKCKNNKTTYYQLQTRSSDEPMTTFVTCVVCGNRWKF